jgi:hypothetical protein
MIKVVSQRKLAFGDTDMTVRTNRGFSAIPILFLMLLPITAATAGSQGGGISEYSNPDSKNTSSYIEFDRQRLADLFGASEKTNPGGAASSENTNPAGTDKLSLTVKPPMPQTMHAGAMGGVSGAKGIQERLDRDMALLLPGNNSAEAGAELLKLLKDFAEQNGVQIAAGNNLPEKKMQGLTKVSARIDTMCDIEQLVQFMAAIGNYPKHLRIEELTINSFRMPAQKKYQIRPSLTIAGYIHSMEGKTTAASASSIKSLEARITSIEDILRQEDRNIEILHELIQVFPRDTYLASYVNRDGTIQLTGRGSSSGDLIQKLERSPYFKDVAALAPLLESGPKDMFNIGAKLEK